MLVRVAVVAGTCVLGAVAAKAEVLGPGQARAFVVGKLFSYTCFDGTAGMGRIFADGSVVGTTRTVWKDPRNEGEALWIIDALTGTFVRCRLHPPPRILVLTEISPNSAIGPESAGLPSEILSLRRRP